MFVGFPHIFINKYYYIAKHIRHNKRTMPMVHTVQETPKKKGIPKNPINIIITCNSQR